MLQRHCIGRHVAFLSLVGLLLGLGAGCTCGRLLEPKDLGQTHPSIKWVYRTGTQLGTFWNSPMIARQCANDVELGEGCVLVHEVGPGGEWNTIVRDTVGLRLKDGKRISPIVATPRSSFEAKELTKDQLTGDSAPPAHSLWQIETDIQLYTVLPADRELYVGKVGQPLSQYIRLMTLPEKGNFGSTLRYVRADDHTMILCFGSEGYVICLDPTMIPAGAKRMTEVVGSR